MTALEIKIAFNVMILEGLKADLDHEYRERRFDIDATIRDCRGLLESINRVENTLIECYEMKEAA